MYFISKKNISLDNRGFTLIEVMVSASIIALLAAIVFANVKTARVKAEEAKALQESKQVSTALELYSADVGNYPNSTTGDLSDLESVLVPQYIFSIPEIGSSVKCSNLGITYKSYNGVAQDSDSGPSNVEYHCGPGEGGYGSPSDTVPDRAVIFFPTSEKLDMKDMLFASSKHSFPVWGKRWWYSSRYFEYNGSCFFVPVFKQIVESNVRCISIGS